MNITDWRAGIIAATRFEAQLMNGILNDAGVRTISTCHDNSAAAIMFDLARVNVLYCSVQPSPSNNFDWVMAFRRNANCGVRKVPIIMLSGPLTAALVLQCKNAGANALIGLPVSAATFIGVTQKVLAKPRPFVECDVYVGPCRRAGIITAGNGRDRRTSDAAQSRDPGRSA